MRFLLYFLTNLNEIWHGHSPWWDEDMLDISSQYDKGSGQGVFPDFYYAL